MSDRSAGPLATCVRAAVRTVTRPPGSDADLLADFVRNREPAAFEQLVRRHAPVVHSACRHILLDPADADDACQATFVFLYRKAHTIRAGRTLGGWLFRVARRAAVEVGRASERRRKSEARAVRPEAVPGADLSWREACAILHEELDRLPEKYRLPLIACYLEGKTQDEAARELGWPGETLRGRIDRGRAKLGQRLRKRGVKLSAGLVAAATASITPAVGLPAVLSPSPAVAAVVRAMTASGRAALVFGGLSLAAGLMAGAIVLGAGAGDPPTPPPAPSAKEASKVAPRADAFGDLLPEGAVARLGTVRFNHGDQLRALLYSPDGKTLVSIGNGRARVWDADTGAEVCQFSTGRTDWDEQAVVTPDGTKLVLLIQGFGGEPLRVFDLPTGKEERAFRLEVKRTEQSIERRNALSPDGRLAALWTPDRVHVYDVDTGKPLIALPKNGRDLRAVSFAGPDRLVTADANRKIEVWDARTGKPDYSFDAEGPVGAIAASPDGKLLATLDHTTSHVERDRDKDVIHLWDLTTRTRRHALESRPNRWFMGLGFSSDGKVLQAYGVRYYDNETTVWDCATGNRLAEVIGTNGQVAALRPDGRRLAAGAEIGKFDVWDLGTGKPVAPAENTRPWVGAVALSQTGDQVVTIGNTSLTTWDGVTGRRLGSVPLRAPHLFERPWCRFSPDGRYAVMVQVEGKDGKAIVWDVPAGKPSHTIPLGVNLHGVTAAFSPDSSRLAVRLPGQKPAVSVRDLKTGNEVAAFSLPAGDGPGHLFFGPDDQALVVTGKRTAAYRLPDGKELFGWKMDPEPLGSKQRLAIVGPDGVMHREEDRLAWRTLVVSPDGALAACILSAGWGPSATMKDRIALCDGRTGKAIRRWGDSGKQSRGYEAMAFSPDSRLLASADGYDVHIWEVATGKEVRACRGHRNEIENLAFSGNGRRLASASHDSTVLIWDLSAPKGGDPAEWWADLLSEDAARGYVAVWRLADAADDVVLPLFRKYLRPITAADATDVRKAIANLDSDEFRARDRAFKVLSDLGYHAAPALRAALDQKPSAEARNRIEQLLAKAVGPPSAGESLRTWRALAALEAKGTPGARQILRELADGAAGAWLTAEAKASLRRVELR
ncbi:MAG TPA: sigma-70 family RNA polymerase sigma factor [Gemmataceae bacterium]|nr:sigma-70 family RNA polymerase sigma factor [Gemmataceae bacterium]